MMFTFKCCGCWTTEIDYKSSQLAQNSRRQIVSLTLSLAFFISGHRYASYRKTLGRSLGLVLPQKNPFWKLSTLHFLILKICLMRCVMMPSIK